MPKKTSLEDIDFEGVLNFLNEASKGLKWGQEKEFVCPICGGRAKARRANSNGHHHAHCEQCGMNVME